MKVLTFDKDRFFVVALIVYVAIQANVSIWSVLFGAVFCTVLSEVLGRVIDGRR